VPTIHKLLSGHRRLSGNGFVQIDWLQTRHEGSQPGLRAKEAKALSGLPRSISTEELDCLNPVPHSKLAATASKKLAASRAVPQLREATVPSPVTEKIAITTSLRPGL
jgi:hypothetical protein